MDRNSTEIKLFSWQFGAYLALKETYFCLCVGVSALDLYSCRVLLILLGYLGDDSCRVLAADHGRRGPFPVSGGHLVDCRSPAKYDAASLDENHPRCRPACPWYHFA